MSIFGTIMSKIFGAGASAAPAPSGNTQAAPAPGGGSATTTAPSDAPAAPATPAPSTQSTQAPSTPAPSTPTADAAPSTAPASVDVAAVLDGLEAKAGQRLDWRHSIVDLMKLVGMDSSHAARKELAAELHYTGDTNDSASMNIWLHKEVMRKLAENGGKLPPDLH